MCGRDEDPTYFDTNPSPDRRLDTLVSPTSEEITVPKKIVAIHITTGPENPRLIDVPDEVESFQRLVGGFFQALPVTLDGSHATLMCDEEGRMKGRDHNLIASVIYGRDAIVGDVLITGIGDANGNTLSVGLSFIAAFKRRFPLVMPEVR